MPSPLAAQAMHSEAEETVPRVSSGVSSGVSSRTWLPAVVCLIAVAAAFSLDTPVANWLRDSGIDRTVKASAIAHVVKYAGLFWYTLVVAGLLVLFHPLHWRAGAFEVCCGLFAGLNSLTKWMAGRYRPFKLSPTDVAQPFHLSPCLGGLRGLFHQASDLSFVSGHVALSFATATGVGVLLWSTRGRVWVYLAYTVACLVLVERVGENAHWLSDATCAAVLGYWGVRGLAVVGVRAGAML